ncbi:MAG: F0F1 ATP synthase subunit B [Saprospiraceae bacterium]|nr:F0F1 ATP synthase subunit B [Saprospiraceae bacterium]
MMEVLFLADFSVIRPDPGLILWTTVVFLLVWIILGRMAFRPIQNALKQREDDIQSSLDEAKRAREEMANLKAENEQLLIEAREERAKILKEAKEAKETIIEEAKDKAKEEAQKIVASAKQEIENQKMAAVTEVKNQMGKMAIEIAEKVMRKDLAADSGQKDFVNRLVDEFKLN